jgi:hypothetical protein
MANEERIVKDPFGNHVRISQDICDEMVLSAHTETLDDTFEVIRKPIILIELTDSPTVQLCYYRAISWDTTLLVICRKVDEEWEAFRCLKNPTHQVISDLLKKGRQLI